MTLVITIKSNIPTVGRGNARTRRNARRAAEKASKQASIGLSRKIAVAVAGSPERAVRASSYEGVKTNLREKAVKPSDDNRCLYEVSIYQAGHRSVREDVTHIVK